MKELRFDCEDGVWRVAFAFDTERAAILLVGGDKGGADQWRVYKKLIAGADARFGGHLATIKTANVSGQVKEKNYGKKSNLMCWLRCRPSVVQKWNSARVSWQRSRTCAWPLRKPTRPRRKPWGSAGHALAH